MKIMIREKEGKIENRIMIRNRMKKGDEGIRMMIRRYSRGRSGEGSNILTCKSRQHFHAQQNTLLHYTTVHYIHQISFIRLSFLLFFLVCLTHIM
jgi:hypothetical protein